MLQLYAKAPPSCDSTFIQGRHSLGIVLPDQVKASAICYKAESFRINEFENHKVDFPSSLNKAVDKRRAEFLAGRIVAKEVLTQLQSSVLQVPVGINRGPLWPEGYIGSITHCDEIAIAIATRSTFARYIGIDIEAVIKEESEHFTRLIVNEDELKYLNLKSIDPRLAMTIAFSAKESLFKALYPHLGFYFDFSAASITELTQDSFKLSLTTDLSNSLYAGRSFSGGYCIKTGRVTTIIVE